MRHHAAEGVAMYWFPCDSCRWKDTDGAGHFMCTDYSPPELHGECTCTASKFMCFDENPRAKCAGYRDKDEWRERYA